MKAVVLEDIDVCAKSAPELLDQLLDGLYYHEFVGQPPALFCVIGGKKAPVVWSKEHQGYRGEVEGYFDFWSPTKGGLMQQARASLLCYVRICESVGIKHSFKLPRCRK